MANNITILTPKARLQINLQWCKGCNLCVGVCQHSVLILDDLGKIKVAKQEKCTGCGLCEAICPDYAIKVIKNA
jgi:NAD-dependent dihydropyrimidine dehydrogenase PreA subunit